MLKALAKLKYIVIFAVIFMAGLNIYLLFQARETRAETNTNPFTGDIIYLQPMGEVETDKLLIAKKILERNFRKGVQILPGEKLKRSFLASGRSQYDAARVMSWAKKNIPEDAFRYIVLVDEDIFTGRFNFIFGQAQIRGKACVLSLARFADTSRSLNPRENALFNRRITNLIMHELGHTMGLRHCVNGKCVMQFANSMPELDNQPIHYCLDCLNRLQGRGILNVFSETGDAVIYLQSVSAVGDINGSQFR